MPSLIVLRPDAVVVMMSVCLQQVPVRSKTPASLRLLFLEALRHGTTALLLCQRFLFLLRTVRRFQGSPTPGMPSFVKCSCCVCCNPMATTSPPPARAGPSRENNQLSVPIRRGRVYHGGSWRGSIETVQLADKQSERRVQPMSGKRAGIARGVCVCPMIDPASRRNCGMRMQVVNGGAVIWKTLNKVETR